MIGWTLAEDTDDRVGLSVDTHCPPDNRTVAAKAVLPEPIRQDDDLVAAGCAFVLDEGTAERERMAVAEHAQESGCGPAGDHPLGPFSSGDVHRASAPGIDVAEGRRPPLPLHVVARRDRPPLATLLLPHHHQAIGLPVWQRREERAVNDAEDGGRGRDAERECEHGHGSKAGSSPKKADAEAGVAEKSRHGWFLRRLVPRSTANTGRHVSMRSSC